MTIFLKILWWIESSKEQHLFEMEINCNINVFTVTFDQFNEIFAIKITKSAPDFGILIELCKY